MFYVKYCQHINKKIIAKYKKKHLKINEIENSIAHTMNEVSMNFRAVTGACRLSYINLAVTDA